ncbi:hypothetical protein Bbelb_396190 [Branchiostoma belcheri]|nr:hypothetical protein Bbelb_396190 [Branchiostoma belcheri]
MDIDQIRAASLGQPSGGVKFPSPAKFGITLGPASQIAISDESPSLIMPAVCQQCGMLLELHHLLRGERGPSASVPSIPTSRDLPQDVWLSQHWSIISKSLTT